MDKSILVQYADLQEEIKDIRCRIIKTEKQIERINSEGTVIDSVKGTRKDGTIGSIRIEGYPYPEHSNKLTKLYLYKAQLSNAEEELLELTNGVEEYINSIEDSRIRRIIQYRVIDNLSWVAIAHRMGGNNTPDGVRMSFNRHLEKC